MERQQGPKELVPICSRTPGASHTVSGQCRGRSYTPEVTSAPDMRVSDAAACPGYGEHLGVPLRTRVTLARKIFHQLLHIGTVQALLIFTLEDFLRV